jgi:hypothetical protein
MEILRIPAQKEHLRRNFAMRSMLMRTAMDFPMRIARAMKEKNRIAALILENASTEYRLAI